MVDPVFGRWGPTEVMERVLDGTWAEVIDGMALIEPESIEFSGTSASISGLGSVEFEAVTSLSLNGVFSSLFDNYMIVVRHQLGASSNYINLQLRVSGTNATGSNYTYQLLDASNTVVQAGRVTATSHRCFSTSTTQRSGDVLYVYGPALAQPTAFRSVNAGGNSDARIEDIAGTHSLSTAYDGFTFIPASSNITGRVAVYGMVK